jgi:hypothetical protein
MQQKYQQGQFRTSMPFGALVNSSSNSSICSTASSSSCSINSAVQPVAMGQQQQVLFDSSNAQKALIHNDTIKKSLDTLMLQKNFICKQIEELAQKVFLFDFSNFELVILILFFYRKWKLRRNLTHRS